MNNTARTVIVKAILQLEIDRALLLDRKDALAAEIRNHEMRLNELAAERDALLEAVGDLSAAERALVQSARDMKSAAGSLPSTIHDVTPNRPARRAGRTRRRVAMPPDGPSLVTLDNVVDDVDTAPIAVTRPDASAL